MYLDESADFDVEGERTVACATVWYVCVCSYEQMLLSVAAP